MPEDLMIAALIVIAMTVFVIRRALRTPRYASGPDWHRRARRPDTDSAALPVNKCHLGKVRHVIDGNTLIISTSTQEIRVRLGAVDCPRNGQYWGVAARRALLELIGGRQIAFESHGADGCGRIIATIYLRDIDSHGWTDVNARMIARGYAWVMRRHYRQLPPARRTELNRLERWAQRNRVGLWQSQRSPARRHERVDNG